MADTLDSVPGQWTLWVRRQESPTTTITYQVAFAASGEVTVTSGATPFTGTWSETGTGTKENVTFQIPDPAGSGKDLHFTGYMVGLAMGGYIKGIGPLLSPGTWSAYKTSD